MKDAQRIDGCRDDAWTMDNKKKKKEKRKRKGRRGGTRKRRRKTAKEAIGWALGKFI